MDQQLPTPKTDNADLFGTVYTKTDLLLFYKEVDQIMTYMFKGNGNFEETITNILSPEKKAAVIAFLKEKKVKMENPVEIKVALSTIPNVGSSLPVVSIKLAFEPTETIIKNISSWFLKKFNQKIILDFTLERSIIGGAYIAVNGLYKDYTLQSKIEKYFDNTEQRRKEEPQNNAESASA